MRVVSVEFQEFMTWYFISFGDEHGLKPIFKLFGLYHSFGIWRQVVHLMSIQDKAFRI